MPEKTFSPRGAGVDGGQLARRGRRASRVGFYGDIERIPYKKRKEKKGGKGGNSFSFYTAWGDSKLFLESRLGHAKLQHGGKKGGAYYRSA